MVFNLQNEADLGNVDKMNTYSAGFKKLITL